MLMEHYKDQCYNKHPKTYIARLIPSLQRSTSIKCNKGGKTFFSSAVASLQEIILIFHCTPFAGKKLNRLSDRRDIVQPSEKSQKAREKKKGHGYLMGKKHRNVPCCFTLLKR